MSKNIISRPLAPTAELDQLKKKYLRPTEDNDMPSHFFKKLNLSL